MRKIMLVCCAVVALGLTSASHLYAWGDHDGGDDYGGGCYYNCDRDETTQPPVYSVPEPATFWLLGAGLIGLVGLHRKKRK